MGLGAVHSFFSFFVDSFTSSLHETNCGCFGIKYKNAADAQMAAVDAATTFFERNARLAMG